MSWVGWKRQVDAFHLTLGFGDQEISQSPKPELLKNGQPLKPDIVADLLSSCKYRVVLDWSAGDDEDQVFLKLQSQLMVTLPAPHDEIQVNIGVVAQQQEEVQEEEEDLPSGKEKVHLNLLVHKQRELLKVVSLTRTVGSGPSGDGLGVLTRVLVPEPIARASVTEELLGYTQNYRSISVLNLSSCFLTVISSTKILSTLSVLLFMSSTSLEFALIESSTMRIHSKVMIYLHSQSFQLLPLLSSLHKLF
jgi:hypothetical protein